MKNLAVLALTLVSAIAFAQFDKVEIKPKPEEVAARRSTINRARETIRPQDRGMFEDVYQAVGDIEMARIGPEFAQEFNNLSSGPRAETADMAALKSALVGFKYSMLEVKKISEPGKRGEAQTALTTFLITQMKALTKTSGGVVNEGQFSEVSTEIGQMVKSGRITQAIKLANEGSKLNRIIIARSGRLNETHKDAATAASYQKALNGLAANLLGVLEEDLKPGTVVFALNPLARINKNGDVTIDDGTELGRAVDIERDLKGSPETVKRLQSQFRESWKEVMRCMGATLGGLKKAS